MKKKKVKIIYNNNITIEYSRCSHISLIILVNGEFGDNLCVWTDILTNFHENKKKKTYNFLASEQPYITFNVQLNRSFWLKAFWYHHIDATRI